MVTQLHTASLAIIIVFEIIGSIFCFGRLGSRLISLRADSWTGLMMMGDICMATAWLLSIGQTVTMYKVTQLTHFGYHASEIAKMPYNFKESSLVTYINAMFYFPVLGLVKASMILLYLRLEGTKQGVRISCFVLLVLTIALSFSTTVTNLLQCLPIAYNWDREAMDLAAQAAAGANQSGILPGGVSWPTGFKDGEYVAGGQCFDLEHFLLITSGLSIFTDLLMLLIPIYMVYDLRLIPRRKVVVLLVLCMGLSVTAVGAARFEILYTAYNPGNMVDLTFSLRSTISQVETDLALVTGCIPDLFPFLRRWFPRLFRAKRHVLPPNPYRYSANSPWRSGSRGKSGTISESKFSYAKRVRQLITSNTMNGRSNIDEEGDCGYSLNTVNWRGDDVRGVEVEVEGNTDIEVSSSHGGIIEAAMENANVIVKTTRVVVEERDADDIYEGNGAMC